MLTAKEKAKLKKLALKQVGKKYVFGVEVKLTDPNPPAFDCSELIQWLFYQVGYAFVDGSRNQYEHSVQLPVASGQVKKKTKGLNRKLKAGSWQLYETGDLAFARRGKLNVGHVGLVVQRQGTRAKGQGKKLNPNPLTLDPFLVIEARNKKVGVVKTTLKEFMGRKSFVGIRRPILKKLSVPSGQLSAKNTTRSKNLKTNSKQLTANS